MSSLAFWVRSGALTSMFMQSSSLPPGSTQAAKIGFNIARREGALKRLWKPAGTAKTAPVGRIAAHDKAGPWPSIARGLKRHTMLVQHGWHVIRRNPAKAAISREA